MKSILSLLFVTLFVNNVISKNVEETIQYLRQAADNIDSKHISINHKLKSIQDIQTELKHLERKVQREVDELLAEHKNNNAKEINLEKKLDLLKQVKATHVASTAELQSIVHEQSRLYRDDEKAQAIPKKESLRKIMDTVKFMEDNKMKTVHDIGNHIETRAAEIEARNKKINSRFAQMKKKVEDNPF